MYNSYDASSQMKYAHENKYAIAEKIQHAIRQQPAYAPTQVNIEYLGLWRDIRNSEFPIWNDKFWHRLGLTFSMSARAHPHTRNRKFHKTKKRAWCAMNRRNHKVISILPVQWSFVFMTASDALTLKKTEQE